MLEDVIKEIKETMEDAIPVLTAKMDKNYEEGKDNISEAFINLKLSVCIKLLDYILDIDNSKKREDLLKEIFDDLYIGEKNE